MPECPQILHDLQINQSLKQEQSEAPRTVIAPFTDMSDYFDSDEFGAEGREGNEACHSCAMCSKLFSTKQNLQEHKQSVHGRKEDKPKCDFCQESFSRQFSLRRHMKRRHGREFAALTTKKKENVKMFRKSGSQARKCKKCHLCGDIVVQFKEHGIRQHSVTEPKQMREEYRRYLCFNNIPELKCEVCEKRFLTKCGRKKHIDSVHSGRKFQCDKCGKYFSSDATLKEHIKRGACSDSKVFLFVCVITF